MTFAQEGEPEPLYVSSCLLVTQSCPNCATSWTVACQAPLSMGFSSREYCSGLPVPPPGDTPDLGMEPASHVSPELQADALLMSHLKINTVYVPP